MPRMGAITAIRFREDARLPEGLNRKKAEARLTQLHAKHGGLTANVVLEDAKNPKSPLHAAIKFWDVNEAAQEQWLTECRHLIRSVYFDVRPVKGSGEVRTVRGFFHLTKKEAPDQTPEGEKGVYLDVRQIMADPKLYQAQLRKALTEFASYRARWQHLNELQPLWDAFDVMQFVADSEAAE